MRKYKVIDQKKFQQNVLGADEFIEYFPEIITTGVELMVMNNRYYIMKNGRVWHELFFFIREEMTNLEPVD